MRTLEKLKKILSTGITQQKLADKIGVSFQTLNSWVNKKSEPRKKHQEKINNVYEIIFGLEKIDSNILKQKRKEKLKYLDKNLLQDILKNKEVLEKLILTITYNTNSIEGSTLTEDATSEIIFQKKNLTKYSIVEHLEALNHKKALLFSLDLVKKKNIEIADILEIHKILMAGIIENAGTFRNHQVRILGSNVVTANYIKIPDLINDFIKIFNEKTEKEKIFFKIAKQHADFEKIHPFSDGNGRTGRLLILILALKNNLPPIVVLKEKKQAYYKYLKEAQINENYNFLEDFLMDALQDFWL